MNRSTDKAALPAPHEYTLVVIDMQPDGFPLALSVRRQVAREVRQAVRLGRPVLIVEYDLECAGKTDDIVMDVLLECDYKHYERQRKSANDGSREVLSACARRGFGTSRFRLCGVMTDECVKATAAGLISLHAHCLIDVVADACITWSGHRYDWSTFSDSARVTVEHDDSGAKRPSFSSGSAA